MTDQLPFWKTKTAAWLLFVAFLAVLIIYRIDTTTRWEIEDLRRKNADLQKRYNREKDRNDSIVAVARDLRGQADSILRDLEKAHEDYQLKIAEYEKRKRDFNTLPESVRDSLILDFLRSNQ